MLPISALPAGKCTGEGAECASITDAVVKFVVNRFQVQKFGKPLTQLCCLVLEQAQLPFYILLALV